MKLKTENRETDYEVRCGIGSFHPPCLQRLVGVRSFLGVFGTLALMSWALYTVTVSQITNIEKAFGLSSSESGWLMTIWELGYLLITIVASYFGSRAHAPVVMGFATVICGISGFITAMPHFFVYVDSFDGTSLEHNTTASNDNLCHNVSDVTSSSDTETLSAAEIAGSSRKSLAYGLLIIGMILQGGGKAPCYPYSSKYLDDSVNKQNTGYYVGIISSIGIIGLVIGYGLGALVNKNYVTFEDVGIGPKDPRFIGAWWLGFIVLGFATMLIAIPLMCFPRTLKPIRHTQEHGHTPRKKVFVLRKELKAIFGTVASVLKSPIYTLTVIASVLQVLSFSCFLSFEPKYLETQFSVPAWQSNLIIGVAGISSFCIGSLLGGYITKRLKMTPLLTIQLIIGAYTAVLALMVVQMFLGCEQPQITNPYSGVTGNLTCDCSGVQYLPICGADIRNYYSPCHAGCSEGTTHIFSNCTLIPGGTAYSGLCPNNCRMLWPFAVNKFILSSIDALAWVPMFLIFLRTASEEEKALALGLSSAITSGFAWLPGPTIGGKLIDSTCLIWKTAANSGTFCGQYDIVGQRFKLHQLMLGLRAGSLLFMTAAMVMAKRNNVWRSDDKPLETKEKEMTMNGRSAYDEELDPVKCTQIANERL